MIKVDSSTIITGVASELIKDLVKHTLDGAQKSWKKSILKSELELEKAFESYVNFTYDRNSKVKTLLYKNVSKPLYNFYESVDVEVENEVISTANVKCLIDKLGNHILITGTGGIGKSTLMKHLFLNSIDVGYCLPLLIELRGFNRKLKENSSLKLVDYLYDDIATKRFDTEKEYFIYALKSGKVLLLLDGFDELDENTSIYIESEIKDFSLNFSECPVILSSRPSNEFIGWSDFIEANALPLTKDKALSLINKLEIEDQILKERFIEELDESLYVKYKSFASIPLLLIIMLITYEMNATIPDNLNDFYDMAFLALFQSHDASKSGYRRDIQSKLSHEEFKEIFSYIAFNSYYNGEYQFTEAKLLEYIERSLNKFDKKVGAQDYLKDLDKSVCMIIREGLMLKFTHRSFQEYFAAVFMSKQSDDIQSEIFKMFVRDRRTNIFRQNVFFTAIKIMQPERYEKNYLYAISKEYKDKSRIELLKELIKGFTLDKQSLVSIRINNLPLFMVYREVIQMLKLRYESDRDNFSEIIKVYVLERKENELTCILDELDNGLLEELLEKIDGKHYFITDFMNWINNFENKNDTSHKKISEILGLI